MSWDQSWPAGPLARACWFNDDMRGALAGWPPADPAGGDSPLRGAEAHPGARPHDILCLPVSKFASGNASRCHAESGSACRMHPTLLDTTAPPN